MTRRGAPLGPGVACGVIGAGAIGCSIAEALLRAGHSVTVFDPDAAAVARARSVGANVGASPAAAVGEAELVLLTVPDTAQIHAAMDGPDGFEGALRADSIVAVMSTVSPATPAMLADRLGGRGVAVLDAPLSGGPERARAGRLTLMVGGPVEAVGRARPVLGVLADELVHVGPVGHGEVAKLVNNLMGAVITIAIAEGLTMAARAGADVRRVVEAVASASGGSWILREWLPETVLRGDLAPRFALALMGKDLELIRELATRLDVPVPAFELARGVYERALAEGHGGEDFSVVAELHAAAAGTTLALEPGEPSGVTGAGEERKPTNDRRGQ